MRAKKCFVMLLTIVSILLTSCGSGVEVFKKSASYIMDDGTELEAVRFTAADGKEYFAVLIDSVNLFDAINLQKDGWVIPRTLGYRGWDEHRYTTMPTMETLFGIPVVEPGEDNPAVDGVVSIAQHAGVVEMLKKLDVLGGNPAHIPAFWSTTIFPKSRDEILTYLLNINSYEQVQVRATKNTDVMSVLLVKSVDRPDGIEENQFWLSKDTTYTARQTLHGRDGYDYYVLFLDTLCTWSEAISLERDGWTLPRSEGKFHPNKTWPNREMERFTIHSYTLEPTIEGMTGAHPMSALFQHNNEDFFNIVPHGKYWLGTIAGYEREYGGMTAYFCEYCPSWRKYWVNNGLIQDKANVMLVKRIRKPAETPVYIDLNEQTLSPMIAKGASGKTYYIVDPTGWTDRVVGGRDLALVMQIERNGFHVPNIEEFADLMHISQIQTNGMEYMDDVDFGLLKTAYNADKRAGQNYLLRDYNGDLVSFCAGYKSHIERVSGGFIETYSPFFRFSNDLWETKVRLIRCVDDENAEVAEIDHIDQDLKMFGLKGSVCSVRNECGSAIESWSLDGRSRTEYTLTFNKAGQLIHDEHDNTYVYASDGSFKRGNHDYTSLNRNAKGQMEQYCDSRPDTDDADGFFISRSFDDEGRMKSKDWNGWCEATHYEYTWGDNGFVSTLDESGTYEGEDGSWSSTSSYEYVSTDEQGNWTERHVTVLSMTTTHEWIEEDDSEPVEKTDTVTTYFVEKRTIKYYTE